MEWSFPQAGIAKWELRNAQQWFSHCLNELNDPRLNERAQNVEIA